MLRKRLMVSTGAMAVLLTMSAMPAAAQSTMDSRTEFTFNRPVELPGTTLPPGTYIFRFADSTTGKRVMLVQAKDAGNKNYGMFMTISAQRPSPSDDAELRFLETPAGQPAAIKTWWYPRNTIGREFIYPKSQALRLAKATNSTVLATQAENVSGDQKSGDLAYVSPTGQETPLTDEQLVDAAATTPPVGASQAASADTSAARAPAQEGTMARATLPRTSTPLAGIGLLGMLSLLGGAWTRFRS